MAGMQLQAFVRRYIITLVTMELGNSVSILDGACFQRRHDEMDENRVWFLVKQACEEEGVVFPTDSAKQLFTVDIGRDVVVRKRS